MTEYYLFEAHLGGVYWTADEDFNPGYCEQCGDSDWRIGTFSTIKELKKLLNDAGYDSEYIKESLAEFKAEQKRGIIL